jgi:hypothetical protein
MSVPLLWQQGGAGSTMLKIKALLCRSVKTMGKITGSIGGGMGHKGRKKYGKERFMGASDAELALLEALGRGQLEHPTPTPSEPRSPVPVSPARGVPPSEER